MTGENKISSTDVVTQEKVKLKKPKLYRVILLNDDYTPMEYVVSLLKIVFKKSESEAVNIMLMVHKKGSGICTSSILIKKEILIKINGFDRSGLPSYCSSIIKFLFFSILGNSFKKRKYFNRASGFYNAFIGKSSWYRPNLKD